MVITFIRIESDRGINNTDYLIVLQIYNNLNKFASFQQTQWLHFVI